MQDVRRELVRDRKDAEANEGFDDFICAADIELLPVTVEPAKAARAGRQRFGKGNHPAHLNCDDCFAYALAKVEQDKLLCKGDDFPQTDIESALKP